MHQKTTTLSPTETHHPETIPLPTHALHQPSGPVSDPKTPLYFAYGSNLSPTQMRMRCEFHPGFSAKPVALARLDGWRWFICQQGYANVYPPAGLRVRETKDEGEDSGEKAIPQSGDEDTVYGVLYEMAADDERLLDGYEGVDHDAGASVSTMMDGAVRPTEQGSGDYNKWYLPAEVTKWLDEGQRELRGSESMQTVLVYVDESSLRVGPPNEEYIPRMDRAIREAIELGFPEKWATEVMRKFV